MELRAYQEAARRAIEEEWEAGRKRTLLVLPTGTGKTVVFANVAKDVVDAGGKVLVLAHRGELLQQAADKLSAATGLGCSVEKAEQTSIGEWFRVVVGSVQTMMREKRLQQFAPDEFDAIIVDEAHHALSDSYQTVLTHFDCADVLGVTATPDRADRRNMAEYFQSIAYEYSLPQAIKDGYLCPIKAQTVPLKLDLTGVRVTHGDFAAADVGTALDPYLYQIADEMIAAGCSERRTVVFLPLVATSKKFCRILNAKGLRAVEVNGESADRAEMLAAFDAGEYDVLCNSMLLCLDKETEVLTSRGFVGIEEISEDDEVANWNFDGSVFFEKPKEIVRRPLGLDEHMVSIDSKTINLRVTNTHRMIVSCGEDGKKWKKVPAETLRNGHHLPSSGHAAPIAFEMPEPPYERLTHKRIESGELSYKRPEDLTIDECRFIGFFLAEGTRTELRSGGIEYKVSQVTDKYPAIVAWFDDVVKAVGFSCVRKERYQRNVGRNVTYWSFPRGTGHSSQKRDGLFCIEPYLDKDDPRFLWSLDEEHFDAFVEGFWFGDGWHGSGEDGMPDSVYLPGCYGALFDAMCAVGSVRGWRCSIFERPQKNPLHSMQYGLRMIKGRDLMISCKTKIAHEPYQEEEVWCVRTSTKNIITRRKGRVCIMGNTEGWDCPAVDCIVVLRATKSRPLYAQMVGRGTRLSPETGKDHLLLLDFLWQTNTHELCRPAYLVTESEDVARAMTQALELSGCPEDLDVIEHQAQEDVVREREEALAEKLAASRKRKRSLVDPLQFEMSIMAEDLSGYVPAFPWEMAPASDKQKEALEKAGIFPDDVECAGKASMLLDRLQKRNIEGLSTPKQIRLLEQRGFRDVGTWSREDASKMIGRISANGWRTPNTVNPATYKPGEAA